MSAAAKFLITIFDSWFEGLGVKNPRGICTQYPILTQ